MDETTPLLATTFSDVEAATTGPRTNANPCDDPQSNVAVEDVDEPFSVFISEHGAPAPSLGLTGGIDLLSTSVARRNSIAFFAQDEESMRQYRRRLSSAAASTLPKLKTQHIEHSQRSASIATQGPDPAFEPTSEDRHNDEEVEFSYNITKSQFSWIFVGMLLTWFVASFDSTLMASSHPVITSYFDAANSAAWLSTSFLLTSTAFQPVFGRVSDTFGRKKPFIFCMVIFTVGTGLCGLAQSIIQFICARALCGLGAGGAMALGVIIVADLIPLHRRAPYLAVLNLANGVATSLGAAIGGFLADALGWRWEFGIQVPPLLLCLALTATYLPPKLGPCLFDTQDTSLLETLRKFDISGSLLLTFSVTCLVLGLNLGGNVLPWDHPFIIGSLVLAGMLAVLFIVAEQRVSQPIMPIRLLTRVPSTNLILSNLFGCITMNTILFNVPLYFQGALLDTPTQSGFRLIIPFVLGMAASFATGFVINATKTVTPCMLFGAVLMLAGSVLLAVMPASLPNLAYSLIIAISTVGQGVNFPTYSIGLLAITEAEDMAVAMGTIFLFRNLGNVLGVAISSLVAQNALLHYLLILVTGDGAGDIIKKVRQNVEVIRYLEPKQRSQVIGAYTATMKLTFGQGAVSALIGLLLVVNIKLPKLIARQQQVHTD